MIDPELLLQGYRLGVFPMAMNDDSIEWFSPDPRAVLPLEDFHVPHALRRLARRKAFEITIDKAFSAVIQACAKRENTWINRDIIDSYTRLHELGHAHLHSWRSWNICAHASSSSWTHNGLRPTCNSLAVSKFREPIICVCCGEPSICRGDSRKAVRVPSSQQRCLSSW
jgi:hypothetical protein